MDLKHRTNTLGPTMCAVCYPVFDRKRADKGSYAHLITSLMVTHPHS